eukprot:CAMPEP_0119466588 /NCGR_PEP_ID=MMETSP1344-20130328/1177_1 /TAXON_ID=236787 /ORGANISM="Florenciella parvula, Strain CCMP2471" /LENGTH=103 /DNA_ID=CAMNT_0007498915 /DNA_START=708 /DNA_END=1018 /DNA_ORIENTATION=-
MKAVDEVRVEELGVAERVVVDGEIDGRGHSVAALEAHLLVVDEEDVRSAREGPARPCDHKRVAVEVDRRLDKGGLVEHEECDTAEQARAEDARGKFRVPIGVM